MGTEPCSYQPGFFQYATKQCNDTLKKGEVGFPVQKTQSSDVSFASLNNLMSLALALKPQAVVLLTPVDMPRDKAVALCDKFLNK